jgi:hypothetical protein
VEEALQRSTTPKEEKEAQEAKINAQRLLAEQRRREQVADIKAKAHERVEATRSKASGLGSLSGFFSFRDFVTLQLVQVFFAMFLALSFLGMLVGLAFSPSAILVAQIVAAVIGIVLVTIFLELVVVVFRIAATLEAINEKLDAIGDGSK